MGWGIPPHQRSSSRRAVVCVSFSLVAFSGKLFFLVSKCVVLCCVVCGVGVCDIIFLGVLSFAVEQSLLIELSNITI